MVKVVGGGSYHGDELSLGFEELADPEDSEDHVQVHVESLLFLLIVEFQFLSLWVEFGIRICDDLSHGINAGHAKYPDDDADNLGEEDDNWDTDNLFRVIKEVGRSIDYVNCNLQRVLVAHDSKEENESKDEEGNGGSQHVASNFIIGISSSRWIHLEITIETCS